MASGNDMKAHNTTYSSFIGMAKWGTIVCVAVAAFVIFMITR